MKIKRRRVFVFIIALFIAGTAAAQDAKQARVLLSRISRGRSVVYLLGSVHVAKPDIYPLNDYIEKAFTGSVRLVVEVDVRKVDQSALQRKLIDLGMLPEGRTLGEVLEAETARRLEAKFAELGVTAESFDRFKPWVVYLALAELDMARLGYQAENGVDLYFLKRAENRQVMELESAESQVGLLAGFSDPEQQELLAEYLEQSGKMEEGISVLFDAWFAGDAQRMAAIVDAEFSGTATGRRVEEVLLRTRDAAMTVKIKNLLTLPGASFVVVGAAHLCGEGSIVDLLQKDGYEVTNQRGE